MSQRNPSSSPSIRGLIQAVSSLLSPPSFEPPTPARTVQLRTGRTSRKLDRYDPTVSGGSFSGMGILVVHGGGFVMGSRTMKPVLNIVRHLIAEGATVFSTDYTLVFRGGTLVRQTAEVRETARWIQDNHAFSSLVGIGLSAGVASLFHSAQGAQPRYFDGLVSIYGALDFSNRPSPLIGLVYRNLLGTRTDASWSSFSPLRALNNAKYTAPLLLIHGEQDRVCPLGAAQTLHAERLEAGYPSELWVAPGETHGFMNRESSPNAISAIQVLLQFLRKTAETSGASCNEPA